MSRAGCTAAQCRSDLLATTAHHHNAYADTLWLCYSLRHPLASWCRVRHLGDTAPHTGPILARVPPTTRGGTGQLTLKIDGVAHADLDLAICGPCKHGVIEHIRTDEHHRRRGFGRVLIAAGRLPDW